MSPIPRGERLIIALIGKRNAGKSSLINALVGQEIAIVSEVPGTTTDPVDKHYELLPLGPVTFYDTAGVDDEGNLGEQRVRSTRKVLYRADIVLFVNDNQPLCPAELSMLEKIREMEIPTLMVLNKADLQPLCLQNVDYCKDLNIPWVSVSALNKDGILDAKNHLINLAPKYKLEKRILMGDLIEPKSTIILVCPIDSAAPKGRLILPQVQAIRDILDHDAQAMVVKETELVSAIQSFKEYPYMVVTDSQVVDQVNRDTPPEILMTTFSILYARYKGELEALLSGIDQIDKLKDGDRILIAEACSHHVQEDDIGRNKLPKWLKEYTGKELHFDVFAGHDFPEDLEKYSIAIHCGACMINPMEMNRRILEAQRRGVPITNYGLCISKLKGVLDRAIKPFYPQGR